MNAASLHTVLGAGSSARSTNTVVGGGGVKPASGQGFTPASAGEQSAGATAATPTQSAEPTAEQVLQSIMQVLGDEYGDPIRGADGTIYMERKTPNVTNGTYSLSFLVVGKLDAATGKLTPSPQVVQLVQAKAKQADGGKRVLVQIGDQMVWQTIATGEDGKPVVTEMTVATEQEIAAHKQQEAAQAAQQGAKSKLENNVDWQRKLGTVAQQLGIFGSTGQLIMGLSGGPNPYTGKPGAGWMSGWILAQRLNGKAEGKLLPQWLQSGPVATALEWGIQAYGMLDMGNDIRVIRDFLKKAPAREAINPAAMQQLVAQGHHPHVANALAKFGSDLRAGELRLVDGAMDSAIINAKTGAVDLVRKSDLHQAFQATDPLQDAGLKARGAIDAGVTKGLGLLKGLVQPAMMGATALGLVSSVISVKNLVAQNGASVLVDTQRGRGALLGALSSAAFLGMYTLPMILPGLGVAGAALAAASSAVNVASNVLGGVQMLNSYGLFGDEGFLNNDALRAAFLIPPLTPIGAFAFWMKSRKKKAEAEAAKLEAAKELAVEKIKQQREMAKLQLQSTGQIAGAVQGEDGTISVSTGVPKDITRLAAQMTGTSARPVAAATSPASSGTNEALAQQRQQLTMTAKPIR